MPEFIIKLGKLDKKLIWTLIYALSLILIYSVNEIFLVNKQHLALSQVGQSIGQIAIILIPVIFCYKDENKTENKTENKCTKKNAKYFSYLILLGLLLNAMIGINAIFFKSTSNHHESKFCSKEGVEIIFITLITMFFLKYNYFIHHIISIIIFCLVGVFIDSLINNWKQEFENKKFYHIIMYFAIILVEIFNYCYQKYMMDTLYYNYWNITLANGLSLFVQTGIYFVMILINEKEKSFNNLSTGYIVFGFIINVILGFFQYLSRILILHYFAPNHMLIAYEIMKIFFVLYLSNDINKWYSMIFFAFQLFILMFYLEILEFNFCKLNENTKRRISERAKIEELDNNCERFSVNNNQIDVGAGYTINQTNHRHIKTENEMSMMDKIEGFENSLSESKFSESVTNGINLN